MKTLTKNLRSSENTSLPTTLIERQGKAESYLDLFSKFTTYKHRRFNPFLKWLKSNPQLDEDVVYHFFNFWYPVSKHQPQILFRIAAAYPDWKDRKLIYDNLVEEDGYVKHGDQPHYELLEKLIIKLGGRLKVDPEAEALVAKFHKSLDAMTAAQATGYVAAIEHPALDISDYFTTITTLCGYPELLSSDPYLSIHIDVEPNHIIWSHGNALDWIQDINKQKNEGYDKHEVIKAFQDAMQFWDQFWNLAFRKLGYPS